MSGFLAGAGVLLAAAAAAAAILLPAGRVRSAAMLAALILFPALILGDQWHSRAIVDLRDNTGRFVALGVLAVAISVSLATAFRRWPVLLPWQSLRLCHSASRCTPAETPPTSWSRSIW